LAWRRFFNRPALVYSLLIVLLLILPAALWWNYWRPAKTVGEIAELKTIYRSMRPVEIRIAGFDYAPQRVLRGADKTGLDEIKRQSIGLNLQRAARENPSAETDADLGVFYLTERKFAEAAAQFEKALQFDPDNARLRADFGAALLEKAKTESDEPVKAELLKKALAELDKSLQGDDSRLETQFNRALCLQEMNLPAEATEAWRKYLEKDPDSGWAEEAQRNLDLLSKRSSS
jgi:tetratricopeptide (TPR) repeat protein